MSLCYLLLQAAVGAAPPLPADPEPPPIWARTPVRLGTLSRWTSLVGTSPDGRELLFTCGQKLAVYDLTAGKVRLEVRTRESLHSAAVSPDGKLLVIAEWRDGFTFRDYRTGKLLKTVSPGESMGASQVRFTSDGKRLLGYCYWGGKWKLWVYDVKAGKEVGWPAVDTGDRAGRLVRPWPRGFGPTVLVSDRRSSSGRQDGHTVWAMDPDTGKARREVKLRPTDYFLFDVSPDGKRLVCMRPGDDPRVVDLTTGEDLFSLPGHKRWVTAAAYSPGGGLLATASGTTTNGFALALTNRRPPRAGPTEVIVRAGSGRALATWRCDPPVDFYFLGFSSDGKYLHAVTYPQGKSETRELWLWGRLPRIPADREPLPREDPALPEKVKKLIRDLAASQRSREERVEAIYLAGLSRLPTEREKAAAVKTYGKQLDGVAGLQRLAESLLSRKQ